MVIFVIKLYWLYLLLNQGFWAPRFLFGSMVSSNTKRVSLGNSKVAPAWRSHIGNMETATLGVRLCTCVTLPRPRSGES